MKNSPIDVVITWVDGNDPEWQKEKKRVTAGVNVDSDDRVQRYREWDNLKYIFRGIEKYMPWVNHVFLVTCGHYPRWMKLECHKLTLVRHKDFIPEEYLPTFNASTIELNLHRIPELSENFIYFNDDMFVLRETYDTDFFMNNLPCDSVGFSALGAKYSEDGKSIYGNNVMNTRLVAKNFKKSQVMKENWMKFWDIRNGRDLLKTISVLPYKNITGFNQVHTAHSYMKHSFDEAWEKANLDLDLTCKKKLRPEFGEWSWGIRYWQICKGEFCIRRRNFSVFFDMYFTGDEKKVLKEIRHPHHKLMCINDNIKNDNDFEYIKKSINDELEKRFPEKSIFEL